MPDTNVNKELSSLGSKALILAVLEIFFLLFTIFFFVGAFFMAIFIIILLIVITAFRILFAGNLKNANKVINNVRLDQCKSKIISSTILFFFGTFFFMIGFLGIAIIANQGSATPGQVIPLIFSIIIGIILLFVSGFIEYQAWDRLEIFFGENLSLFPSSIASSGKNSSTVLKIGGIMNITIVLIIIGSILRIIGFFILTTIKKLEGEAPLAVPTAQAVPTTQPPPAPVTSEPAKRFCPNCGSPILGDEKYCGACGSEL